MFKIEKDKQWLIVYYDDKEYRFNAAKAAVKPQVVKYDSDY